MDLETVCETDGAGLGLAALHEGGDQVTILQVCVSDGGYRIPCSSDLSTMATDIAGFKYNPISSNFPWPAESEITTCPFPQMINFRNDSSRGMMENLKAFFGVPLPVIRQPSQMFCLPKYGRDASSVCV